MRWEFRNFTTNDGLPSSEVHQVLSDSRNFIWFATDHGACRYDGYRFETFNLPDNSILSMYEDAKKRIWFVSFSGHLFYYEKGKINSYKYNAEVLKGIEQAIINKLYVDSVNNVYVSTQNFGSFKINAKGELLRLSTPGRYIVFEIFETDNGDYFTHVTKYRSSTIPRLLNTPDLTSLIIKKKNSEIRIDFPYYLINERKSGARRLRNGNLVFFARNFLFNISENGSYSLKKFENNILDVEEFDQGNILIATLGNGLLLLDRDNKIIANYFPGLTITSVEKDYEGGMWFSTTQEGVFYLNSLQMKHLANGQNTILEKITCLAVEKDSTIWAGTGKNELLRFKGEKQLQFIQLPVNHIISIDTILQPAGILVSVGRINEKPFNVNVTHYKGDDLIAVQNLSGFIKVHGEFFTGDVSGVHKVNFEKPMMEIQNSKVFRVSNLFLDSKENIIVGNLFGLWYYKDGKLSPYDSTKEILRSRITDINEFKNQFLCLGTRGKGFLIYTGDSLYQLTSANGLASDNIRKIFIDDNIIWLATNNGISRLTLQSLTPLKYTIQNIGVQDGLLSNEVNDINKLGDNVIAATNRGISAFQKNLFIGKKHLPLSFYFTGIKINGFDTTLSESYRLNYRQRNLFLSFVALNYRENSGIEYRYRLNGIDSNWAYTTGREIQLNPLPYGKFTIEIQARRKGENWANAKSLPLHINCRPPFWRTLWFWIASFLAAIFILFLFYTDRIKRIRKREKERTLVNKKLAEMEMKALRAQMNPHFIFNVLNSIHYYITHNDNEKAQYYLTKFAKLIRMTLDNSRTTFISLADELSLLQLYVDLEKIRFEGQFEYEIKVSDDIATNAVKIPNMLIQPYVENSIKHGFKTEKRGAFVWINISSSNGKVICTIEDNGIGRQMAGTLSAKHNKEHHSSTGMTIIDDKIGALKMYYNYDISSQTTDLQDEKGNSLGTRVVLTFPAKFEIT